MIKWLLNLFKPKKEKEVNGSELSTITQDEKVSNSSIKSRGNYEIINDNKELPEQIIKWNSLSTYEFEKTKIDEYKFLRKERVVGCYYRQENIDEVLKEFKKSDTLRFKVIIENDFENEHDSNALKVSIIYLADDQMRKIHIGYLSKETALEFKKYSDDIKASLLKIENIDYKDTYVAIYLKENLVDELKANNERLEAERKKIEEEIKIKRINSNIAYEMNQLGMTLEKMGKIDEAAEKYRESIKMGFDGTYPFDRLNIYYRKQKDYDNEILNCDNAIKLFEKLKVLNNAGAVENVNKYSERKDRAVELKEKELQKQKELEERIKAKEERIKAKQIERDIRLMEKQEKNNNLDQISLNKQLESTRVCTICKIEKPIEEFEKSGKDSKGNIKYKHQCKKCRNELRRKKKEELNQ